MTGRRSAQIGERQVHHVRPFRNSRDVVRGDDLTLTSSESDSRMVRAEMCGWHDARARGGPGGGKRNVSETDILGRSQMDG